MSKSRRWRHGDPASRMLLMLAFAVMGGTAHAICPPQNSDGTVIRNGDLLLAYRPLLKIESGAAAQGIPMARHFAMEVQLCDKGDVSTAQLTGVDASMPAHKHGMNYRPTIRPLGNGRFHVDGMMLHMSGQWEFAFEVRAGKDLMRLTHDVRAD